MTNNNENVSKEIKKVKSPLDLAKTTYNRLIEDYIGSQTKPNFMECINVELDNNHTKPDKNAFLHETSGSNIYSVHYNKKKMVLNIKVVTNFTIKDAMSVKIVHNNKGKDKDEEYISLTLKADNGFEQSDIKISGLSKSDYNKFQEALCMESNMFQTSFTVREFKTFYEEFMKPLFNKNKVIIYKNCGKLSPNKFIGGDFLVDNNKIYYANEQGLIPTEDKTVFVKSSDEYPYKLPKLSKSTKAPCIVARNFIDNIIESWGENYVLALLAIGHMIMGLYFDKFANSSGGAPILILSGISGCGKSTLIQNGISIFGLGEDFLIAGNSTVLGQQFFAHSVNCMNVCVDDLSDFVISSGAYESNIKGMYKAIPRAKKRNHGKELSIEHQCSQIVYSTNSTLPDIPELVNRANLITITKNSLDTNKYKYLSEHKENNKELSLILPELVKIDEKYVKQLHSDLVKYLRQNVDDTGIPRLLHNIAYMWTGLKLLADMAGVNLENIKEKIVDYAKETVDKYKDLPTPVDMLINSLFTLKNLDKIEENKHYRLEQDGDKVYLIFHRDTLIEAYNRSFNDEKQKIKIKVFNNYLKNDERYIETRKTVYYRHSVGKYGNRRNSIVLDITDNPDVWEFSGFPEPIKHQDKVREPLTEIHNVLNNIT